jgi:hypothetical protein
MTPALFAGVEPLEVFAGLLAELDSEGGVSEFYHRICEAICRLTTMRRAAIFMSEAKDRRVRPVGAHGTPFEPLAALRLTLLDTPIAQQALLRDEVVVVSDRGGRPARVRRAAGDHDAGVHADVGGRPRLRRDLRGPRRRALRAVGR